jgi:hypothetical protein
LADPTPANAKNREAADKKNKRGEENRGGDEDLNDTHAPAATRADGNGEEAANAACREIEELRDAMAEAIQEMEMEIVQREIRGNGGGGREEAASEREREARGDAEGQTEQQRQQYPQQKQQRVADTPDLTTLRTAAVPESSAAGQPPLQLIQQGLRDRFGADILRHPEETTRQMDRINEENVGTSSFQEGRPATATKRPETPEERYRKMGKAPMMEATPKNYTPSGRGREQSTPPTTRYAGTHHLHMKSPLGEPAAM